MFPPGQVFTTPYVILQCHTVIATGAGDRGSAKTKGGKKRKCVVHPWKCAPRARPGKEINLVYEAGFPGCFADFSLLWRALLEN